MVSQSFPFISLLGGIGLAGIGVAEAGTKMWAMGEKIGALVPLTRLELCGDGEKI